MPGRVTTGDPPILGALRLEAAFGLAGLTAPGMAGRVPVVSGRLPGVTGLPMVPGGEPGGAACAGALPDVEPLPPVPADPEPLLLLWLKAVWGRATASAKPRRASGSGCFMAFSSVAIGINAAENPPFRALPMAAADVL